MRLAKAVVAALVILLSANVAMVITVAPVREPQWLVGISTLRHLLLHMAFTGFGIIVGASAVLLYQALSRPGGPK